MGDDGADGLLELRRAGGHTIAEHESTAVVYGMPKAAVDRGAACECLPLDDIAPRILELISAAEEALMDRASRILVVEDSDTQALKLQLMLENEGLRGRLRGDGGARARGAQPAACRIS